MKSRNIVSLNQMENNLRSLAYRNWDIRDIDSVSVSQSTKSYGRSRNLAAIGDSNRKITSRLNFKNNIKGRSQPLISASRYLSCIESSSQTNANSEASSWAITSRAMNVDLEDVGPEGSVFSRGTPSLEGGPSLDLCRGSMDNVNCKKSHAFLSNLFFIMQQKDKFFEDKVSKTPIIVSVEPKFKTRTIYFSSVENWCSIDGSLILIYWS